MLEDTILKYALQNAIRFDGKANTNAVLGKVLKEHPEYKEVLKEIKDKLLKIINEVNSLSLQEQKRNLESIAPELLVVHYTERKNELPELKNAKKGEVIMRFEPSPSGPLHVGHAYVLGLNSEYCRMYDGKMILRIADTNPKNIYEESYNLIVDDANWVTKGNLSEVIVQSDRMSLYYEYMEQLIRVGGTYICTCELEQYKELLIKSIACPCRELRSNEQFKRWEGMLSDYKQGSAVARLKTELTHKNPAIRDFPLCRIIETPHPRQGRKYRVWPLMNLAVAVDDIESKVTHVIRAKDHYDNAIRQRYIFDYLKKPFPQALFVGRINFIGLIVSCSKTRPLIEDGTYRGWDDIRLPFLQALMKRGFQPGAFIKYAITVGVTLNDKTVSKEDFFKSIEAFNREIIEPISDRYFFISNPIKINIENAPEQNIELELHPDNKKGGRRFHTDKEFFIANDDFEKIKDNEIVRLMDCLNFVKNANKFLFESLEYLRFKEKGALIIQWLPAEEEIVSVEVLMPDNSIISGIAENSVSKLKIGSIVQFTRFGFCRLDVILDDKFIFRFGHR